MKHLSVILAAALATSVGAQTQALLVDPGGPTLTYTNPGANFFDLQVTNPNGITLESLGLQLNSPVGTVGTIEVWSVPSTHIGQETSQANWVQRSSGFITGGTFGITCQAAVTPNGLFFGPGTYGIAVVYTGVNHVFDGTVTYPTGPHMDANLLVRNGTTQSTAWVSAPLNAFVFGGNLYAGTLMEFDLYYSVGANVNSCPLCEISGEGSNINSASAYQLFGEPAAAVDASATLQGRVMTFTPNSSGTGYTLSDGTGTGPVYVPPSGNETTLPPMDDQEVYAQTQLIYRAPTATGTLFTSDFFINSNGYVSLAQLQSPFVAAPVDPQGIMQGIAAAFFAYHNYDNSEVGSGNISYEEDVANSIFYVTWDNVESEPAFIPNPSTIQFQFESASGRVHVVFDQIDAIGGSTWSGGDNTLIGWSPAAASPHTDAFDFATLQASPLTLTMPEVYPFTLASNGPPTLNSTFDLVSLNEPTAGIGLNMLDVATLTTPMYLSVFGSPANAVLHLDPNTAIFNTISNIPGVGSMSLAVPVPNNPALVGFQLHSQSFWVDLAGANVPFTDLITSNLITCTIG